MHFTWDERKAATNLAKRGVTFEEAATAFRDPLALVEPDATHEDRLVLLGETSGSRLLFVVHVEIDEDELVRLISARTATPHERRRYEESP